MSKSSESRINRVFRLTKFGYISYLLMWTICLLGMLLNLFFTHQLSLDPEGSKIGLTDFVHFYTAGKITLSPQRDMFYSWDVQKQFIENITQTKIVGDDFYTQYVPIVFMFMAPFALIPSIDVAHLLFEAIDLGVGLIGCWMLLKHFNWTKNRTAQLVLLGGLASMPSWNTWMLGQISWLYLGIMAFYTLFLLNKSDLKGGLALALAVIKPQYAVFLAIPALAMKRYRLILAAIIWEILLLILCLFTFGLKAILAYPFALNQCESGFTSIKTNTMFGISSFLSYFLPRAITYRSGLILLATSLILITFFACRRLKNKSGMSINWLVSLIVLASILFSPHTHSHDCLLIALPALLTLPFYAAQPQMQARSLLLWRWIYYLMPIISWCVHWLVLFNLPGNILLTALMTILFVCAIKQFAIENELYNKDLAA